MNPKLAHPAPVGAAILFFLSLTAAAADTPDSNVMIALDQCKQGYTGDVSIYGEDGWTLKSAYDPKQNCKNNAGDESISINSAAVESTPQIRTARVTFNNDHNSVFELRNNGACRVAYGGVRDLYDYFLKQQDEYCTKLNAAWKDASTCGGIEKKCQDQYKALRDVNKAYAELLDDKRKAAKEYFMALGTAVKIAGENYRSDFDKLDPFFKKQRSLAAGTAPLTLASDALPDSPEVKAANGNKVTQTTDKSKALEAYYNLLKGSDLTVTRNDGINRHTGLLIQEEDAAIKNMKTFGEPFFQHIVKNRDVASSLSGWVGDQLARIDQNGSTNTENKISNTINKFSPVATAGVPLAQQFMKGQNGPDLPGVKEITGGSHAPVAEVAAAAGLGALAARSLDGSGRSAGPSEAPAVATPPAQHGETTSFGNGNGDEPKLAKDHKDGSPVAGNNATKTEGAAGKTEEPGVNNGLLGGISEGASRSLGKGRNVAAVPAAAAAGGGVDAGGAGMNESLGNFGPNLEPPHPAPKAAATTPGAEVANLLGQMKNLFNFDENAPGGGMPGAAPLPGAAPPPADPALAAGGTAPDTPTGEAEAQATGVDAAAQPQNNSGDHTGGEVQGSMFGKVDTSLFARVRARHHRCMERGLVLYGLRERVE